MKKDGAKNHIVVRKVLKVLLTAVCGGVLFAGLTLIAEAKHPGQGEVGLTPFLAGTLPYIATRVLGLNHQAANSFVNTMGFDSLVNGIAAGFVFGCLAVGWQLIKRDRKI